MTALRSPNVHTYEGLCFHLKQQSRKFLYFHCKLYLPNILKTVLSSDFVELILNQSTIIF
jgi:hypothetical protein